jgi:diacylglycerol kinase (ATP)
MAMRVCLYWNANAGGAISLDEISALITAAGHNLECVVERPADLPEVFEAPIDCVVAAGGDGTVTRAGRTLAGGSIPLAILPLGTANNIASSLGIGGSPAEAIAAWQHQRFVHIDVGVIQCDDIDGVRAPGSGLPETRFLESVGAGLVVAGINAGRANISKDSDPDAKVAHARELYVETIGRLKPKHYDITLDGTSIAGDYLLVEVLNIPSVGPGVNLSAEVSPADGLLSVVIAAEGDREALAAYLQAMTHNEPASAGLKSWRASHVEIKGLEEFHVDDDVRSAHGATVTIGIKPASLAVMA